MAREPVHLGLPYQQQQTCLQSVGQGLVVPLLLGQAHRSRTKARLRNWMVHHRKQPARVRKSRREPEHPASLMVYPAHSVLSLRT